MQQLPRRWPPRRSPWQSDRMPKKKNLRETPAPYAFGVPLPSLIPLPEVKARLELIFPESFPDRAQLVGIAAARVVFVFLYGGFIEDHERFLRPSHIYFFTEEQSLASSDEARRDWIIGALKPGARPPGKRWYADTSRETIRDDIMRNRLLKLGIMHKRSGGGSVTASTPVNFLARDFAALFDPAVFGEALEASIENWRRAHLDPAMLQRMALRAQGIEARQDDLLIDMPDGARIRVSGDDSARIAKGLIEAFAPRHLQSPAVLWLSASDRKADPQFVARAASVGLYLDLSAELPDLILVDLANPPRFYCCEIVATDGAVTEARRQALLALVRSSNIPESAVRFVSAFEDREAPAFRKNVSQLALDSWVWFRCEPELLVILTTKSRANLVV